MAEDFLKRKDDLPKLPLTRYQPGPEDFSETHFQQSMPSQLSKEKLYQQRQKCELRRLLKHTHPELKMLDDVVDEELAEVLSSETGMTTGETGYEGEVLSRRLIFENCALSDTVSPYTPKRHMAEGKSDVSKKSAVSEKNKERPWSESVKGIIKSDEVPDSCPDTNTEEEMIKIDVQATRRMFENQSVNTSRLYPDNKFQGKVLTSGTETRIVQKPKQECRKEGIHSKSKSNVCTKIPDLTDQPLKSELTIASTDHWFSDKEDFSNNETIFEDEDEPASTPDSQNFGDTIKTSASLFKNNPFIQTNIERENSFVHTSKPQSPVGHSGAAQDYPIDSVKNRAHLFESMPFNKIRQQNKDEVETMVEKIKETLNFLHQVNAIYSGGSIIEVNETMIAKKAKFTLSGAGPEIKYDEVAEGGAQNFVLQLLPHTNLKPQIIYLKEDSKGTMEATVVNVPVHHHQFSTHQDTEFKTANVVQVVEDILNQDNSLRKGVIIQEGVDRCAEVIVYSLYNYFNEEDVKSYCLPQGEKYDEPQSEKRDTSKIENQGQRKGAIESTTSCLLETSKAQTNEGSKRSEITEKGNVKLFKCCIERGDLEYLKSLQTESAEQEQELPPNQNVAGHQTQTGDQAEESTSEFVPVDVKKLKNIFSGDQIPALPKQDVWKNLAQSTTISSFASQNVPLGKSQPSTKCDAGVIFHRHHNDTFRECGTQKQEESCNFTVAPQGSYLQLQTQDDGRVHKAELVEVVDDNDEIDNLQIAIHNLRQATIEAKVLHHSSQVKQNFLAQESSEKSVVLAAASNVRRSKTEAELPQENEVQKEDSYVMQPRWNEFLSASNIISDCHSENTEKCRKDSEEVQTDDTCSNMVQKGMEDVQKPASVSVHSSETTAAQQEDDEVVLQGKLQAALNSLERSNINVTRGDFRAAMIHKNSSKPLKQRSKNIDAISNQKHSNEEVCPLTELKSTQAPPRQEVSKEHLILGKAELPNQSKILNKKAANAVLGTNKRPVGPKPAIPPKPEHLKVNQKDIQSTTAKNLEATQTVRPKETVPQPLPITLLSSKDEHVPVVFIINSGANTVPALQTNKYVNDTIPMSQEIEVSRQVQGSVVTLESDNTDKSAINQQQEMNVPFEKKQTQTVPVKDNMNETDESPVDFQGACRKFEGKNAVSVKHAPVKPKRVKIAQSERKNPKYMSGDDNPSLLAEVFQEPQQTPSGPSFSAPKACGQTPDTKDKHEKDIKQASKVEMREKKGRAETEDERRQRLSVHMDEIMRGNITAAMEIFENLRKQEELQSILSRVEEIEQDTREVDVRSLRGVFENVPDWVVCSDKKKHKKAEEENKDKSMLSTRDTESKSSVAHVFGDLERASEEIINLKEQTLCRLLDIEEAIKKALYSVSTLKSDSDIAGLSCLFKESLGTVRGSPSSGNISKISIGSSRTKSVPIQKSHTAQGHTALPVSQSASVEAGSTNQRVSPPSSPAFISIQSAARKAGKTEVLSSETIVCPACQHSPKTEEKFRTTKTLTCNSPSQNRKKDPRKGGQKHTFHKPPNSNRELSVPEMQTDQKVNNIMDTKTVTENYERTDNLGNWFYSSKTSTVLTAPPDTMTSTSHAVISPATYQVTKYPEVWLPVNQKP